MAVSMADIQHLRKMTGAGMMDCKKALTEAEGDFDKAVEIIRKRGQAIAAKREDRDALEGCVLAGVNGNFAAVVALKCETDFVAKNADFIALTQSILDLALANKPANLDELLTLSLNGMPMKDAILEKSGITGEKMEVGFYEFVNGESPIAYIHPGNKLATVVVFNQPGIEVHACKDVAMQVAAMAPVAVTRDQVPAEIVEKEFIVAKEKAREEGKPENMLDKIAEGRINKFYKESVLMEQEFVKDAKQTIKQYLQSISKDLAATDFKRVTLNAD
ncbi:MAG: translation elongation factor Ts [Bacteroidales bacterium]|nr:translation elongation factor Ts [Bacteroidales bacterium]